MSDHDRGAYTPQTDAPLAFDARQSRGGDRAFPTTLVVSIGVLVVMIVAIVLFYRSGIRGPGQAPVPVGAPVAEIKTPPPPQAQSSQEGAGLQIYKTEGAASAPPAAPTFTPPPEEPHARPTAPVTAQPIAPPSPAAVAASGATAAAKPAPPPPASRDAIGDLLDQKTPAAKPAAAQPVVVASAAAAPAAAKAAAPGAASAQIGAFSSQALAAKGWSDVAAAFAGDMAGKGKHFEPVVRDGKTLYRAAVTGFPSAAAAAAFCAKLKAANHPCIVK
jgi:septal ring-binding cell division protein DamX